MSSKWEAPITIPSGGWSFALTDSDVTGATVTIPAGTYYHSTGTTLASELKSQMDATSARTYTVSFDSSTGKYSIAVSSSTFSITWTDTELRNVLGWTGMASGSSTPDESDVQAEGIWLPKTPVETPYGLESGGIPVSSANVSMSPGGAFYSYHGPKHYRSEYTYVAVTGPRALTSKEETANQSFETFWTDAIRGEAPWCDVPGASLRFHPSASDDSTYFTWNILDQKEPSLVRATEGYDGLWQVSFSVARSG